MSDTFKKLIAVIIIIIAIGMFYFGSFLPLQKAKRYVSVITALRRGEVKSLNDFKANFNKILDFYSPVGQEEVVLYLATDIFNIISGSQGEAVERELIAYIEPRIFQKNTKQLLVMAGIYKTVWIKYGKEADFYKAEDYYQKALVIGPKLPQALYGLFDIYHSSGQKQKAAVVGNEILKYWPNDEQVRRIVTSNK